MRKAQTREHEHLVPQQNRLCWRRHTVNMEPQGSSSSLRSARLYQAGKLRTNCEINLDHLLAEDPEPIPNRHRWAASGGVGMAFTANSHSPTSLMFCCCQTDRSRRLCSTSPHTTTTSTTPNTAQRCRQTFGRVDNGRATLQHSCLQH